MCYDFKWQFPAVPFTDTRPIVPISASPEGNPAKAQRSGFRGERRRKGAGAVFAAGRKRSLADLAATRGCTGFDGGMEAGSAGGGA